MSNPANDHKLACCITTTSSMADAQMIANALLDQSLAACIQIEGPIKSHYDWHGKRNSDQEFRLMIKTIVALWPRLKECVCSIHPYDEPELILIPVIDAADGYRDWVIEQTKAGR
jgi:periplasmic divalent cation tolerance protein